MTSIFEEKSAVYKQNQEVRKLELEAIAKAIEIIFNPNVADSYAGHIKLVQTNFLQMTSSSRHALVKDRAAEMLSISGKLSLMWGDYKDRINELTHHGDERERARL